MKKHKSVVSILLAVMMIFAMMPTMVFAASPKVEWKNNCSSLVFTDAEGNETPYNEVKKTQDPTSGVWHVVVDTEKYSSVPTLVSSAEAYYFDLNGAKLGYLKNGTTPTILPTSWSRADWDAQAAYLAENAPAAISVKLQAGGYVATPAEWGTSGVWTGILKGFSAFDPNNNEAQPLTLSYDVNWVAGASQDGTAANPFVFGTPDPVSVTVAKKPAAATDVALYWDEVKTGNEFVSGTGVAYTGAAHTIVAKPAEGFTVSYKVYEKGSFVDADSISVTNFGDSVTFQVTVKDAKGTDVTPTALQGNKTATVAATNVTSALKFGFVATTSSDASYKVEGADFDAYEWVEPWTASTNAAVKAAIAANKADLMAAFKAVTKVKTKVDKDDNNIVYVSLVDNDATAAEIAALDKTYAQLLKNLGFTSVTGLRTLVAGDADDYYATATVTTNYVNPDQNYEVTFTKAITSKTYKGSKTTSKGKLKKNQTIQFKAETDYTGGTIAYKLINVNTSKIKIDKATGKVTIKKGLKKGTYKFKVKAYIPGMSSIASEVQNVTIKVKK